MMLEPPNDASSRPPHGWPKLSPDGARESVAGTSHIGDVFRHRGALHFRLTEDYNGRSIDSAGQLRNCATHYCEAIYKDTAH
jgi:hypothetical protein